LPRFIHSETGTFKAKRWTVVTKRPAGYSKRGLRACEAIVLVQKYMAKRNLGITENAQARISLTETR
jgi:hypothetical protein